MTKAISATIITLNEEKTIAACIENVKQLCDEVLILDSYSKDKTATIAKALGAKVYFQSFLGDGLQKKKATDLAKNDWVLSIDADEILEEEALKVLLNISLADPKIGYALRRKNFLGDKWLRGIYPDYKVRLYNRQFSYYTDRAIHSFVHCPKKKKLPINIIHPTFENCNEWINKINAFSSSEACYQAAKRKKAVTYLTLVSHTLTTFLKKFIFQGGIFKGKYGLITSLTLSFHTLAKYMKILEIQENNQKERQKKTR